MNEITLHAILNLFALFSVKSRTDITEARDAFSQFLKMHLGLSPPNEYARLFDELIEAYGIEGEPSLTPDIPSLAISIAENLKNRLQYKDQVIVLLRFLELAGRGISKEADTLITSLASTFGISQRDLHIFRQFIGYDVGDIPDGDEFLLVNSRAEPESRVNHICRTPFQGELLFLYLRPAGYYLFRFMGQEQLFLEGNPIIPGRFYALREGSILRGPRIQPVYFSDIDAVYNHLAERPVFTLRGEEVSFRFPHSQHGLAAFSFQETSGNLIAVIGGSGVGKSTLLNILNGTIRPDQGRIMLNDTELFNELAEHQGLIGFVPQDDLLFEELSVWDNIWYNARLCLAGFTPEQISTKIHTILKELELLECKDLKVGSPLKKFISGGQRKRLNIALELVREPAILFVDEPTSGLSSMESETVMLLLKDQARKGRIVIANIHQPSSAIYRLIDRLWILDKGGKPVYAGNPMDAIIYFRSAVGHTSPTESGCSHCGHVNPEQLLQLIEAKQIDASGQLTANRLYTPEHWYKLYKRNIEPVETRRKIPETSMPVSSFQTPGRYMQWRIFSKRNWQIKTSDRQSMLVSLLTAPLLAMIVAWFTRYAPEEPYSLLENKNLVSYLFMSVVVLLFLGMSVSAQDIIRDRKVLKRESFLNLNRISYLNAKIMYFLLLSALQTTLFVVIGNSMLGIQNMHTEYWVVLFSLAVFANLLGLNISSGLDSLVAIYVLIPLLLIPQILLSGLIVSFDDLQKRSAVTDAVPVQGDLMVSRWAFEALAVTQFSRSQYMIHFFDVDKEITRTRYLSDMLLPELKGRIDHITGMAHTGADRDRVAYKLDIVRNEMEKLGRECTDHPPFDAMGLLQVNRIDQDVALAAKEYIDMLLARLHTKNKQLMQERDRIVEEIRNEHGDQYLYALKRAHHNRALEEMMLNTHAREFMKETPAGILQKIAPIYKQPRFNTGRAHFLASEKRIAGIAVDTFYFNTMMIWLMSLVLYFALIFDWLRKIVHIRADRFRPQANRANEQKP